MITPFTKGDPETIAKMNDIVKAVNNLMRMTGDGFVNVQHGLNSATTISFSMHELKARFMNFGGGGGEAHRAFVKTTPGATTSVDVYLYEDASDTEVTVSCYIYGGGNLEDAYPTLVDGMPLYVQYDSITSAWKNVTRIDKIGVNCG